MRRRQRRQEVGFFRRLAEVARRTDEGRRGFVHWIRTRLLVGFLVAFPLVVTLLIGVFLFRLLDSWFRPISNRLFGMPLLGVGLALALFAMLLLGILATNVLGGRLLDLFERWISRLPLISPIYQGARQITEAIHVRDESQFRRVVLLPFPHSAVLSLGFVTREFEGETKFGPEPTALVFVPTTPNPTSGFLVAVRQRDLVTLDVTIEEGIKMAISGGLLTPEQMLAELTEDEDEAGTTRAGEEPRPGRTSAADTGQSDQDV